MVRGPGIGRYGARSRLSLAGRMISETHVKGHKGIGDATQIRIGALGGEFIYLGQRLNLAFTFE